MIRSSIPSSLENLITCSLSPSLISSSSIHLMPEAPVTSDENHKVQSFSFVKLWNSGFCYCFYSIGIVRKNFPIILEVYQFWTSYVLEYIVIFVPKRVSIQWSVHLHQYVVVFAIVVNTWYFCIFAIKMWIIKSKNSRQTFHELM